MGIATRRTTAAAFPLDIDAFSRQDVLSKRKGATYGSKRSYRITTESEESFSRFGQVKVSLSVKYKSSHKPLFDQQITKFQTNSCLLIDDSEDDESISCSRTYEHSLSLSAEEFEKRLTSALKKDDDNEEMPEVGKVVANAFYQAQISLTECPICQKKLPTLPSTALAKRIRSFKTLQDDRDQNFQDIDDFKQRAFTASYAICHRHRAEEELIPQGEEKGYPMTIDYDKIATRLKFYEKHFLDIVIGKKSCPFAEEAAKLEAKFGIQAKSTMMFIQYYEDLMPGYYGPKGSLAIYDALCDMFLKGTQIIKGDRDTMVEFIQTVLIPEASTLLIQEDFKGCSMKDARRIRTESVAFGFLVHNDENDLEIVH